MTLPEPAGHHVAVTPARREGVVLRDPLPWHDLLQVARAAEETGYEAMFVPEVSAREAFTTLAGVALGTSRIKLGTGVVTVEARTEATTAMAAATVQDLSGGRLILGIGAGGVSSARGARPVGLVREFVRAVRAFRVAFEPEGGPPPVWIGALGERMIRLAGEVADGVILNWCTPERVSQARRLIEREAGIMGRDPGSITIAVYVRACLGVEEPLALRALREATGRYAAIPQYLRQFEAMGLGDDASLAVKAYRGGRPGEVPEPLVRALTVVGGRSEALARFDAYRVAGADLVLCYPVPALDRFSSILGTVLAAAPFPDLER
jgi:alkanesulfonate monooxygenase SsuD/methylene tetrahydromethanopterin reductase-like flavin-dependent oxidoreductase (luciferase family)